MTKKLTVVISQGRGGSSSRQVMEGGLAEALKDWPSLDVVVLPHLYDLAPDGPGTQRLQAVDGDMIVLSWLYPRAAFWVLDANGVKGRMGRSPLFPEEELPEAAASSPRQDDDATGRTIWCLDLRNHDELEPTLAEIERIAVEATGEPVVSLGHEVASSAESPLLEEGTRYRWYPVIDYSRCGNCLECLNFCLFGVFGMDESGHLIVEQPDACRDGCPACSRVCASRAIIFPQHNSPAIAGDPEAADDGFNLDLMQLLGTAGAAELAAVERDRALSKRSKGEESGARKPAQNDDLDQLVDDLDGMDL